MRWSATEQRCDASRASIGKLRLKGSLFDSTYTRCERPKRIQSVQTHLHLTGLPPKAGKTDVSHAGHLLELQDARDLVASSRRLPWEGETVKVHIRDAHRVKAQVWETLLKVLEEPPPHVQFHLYAPSTDSVPSTIRSRSHVTREHLPDPQPEDAHRLVRLVEGGNAVDIVREADRHTELPDTRRSIESLWIYGVHTGRLDCANLSEYYLRRLRPGVSTRVVMKALLLTLAVRNRSRKASHAG